jgi:hypothetical protein
VTAPRPSEESVFVAVCAWCKRVRIEERWLQGGEAVRALRRFDDAKPPSFTHTICSSCFELQPRVTE